MRTYVTFKNTFCYENYLNNINIEHRKALTRFRISAHNLAIERGRYSRPPTPLENRTCRFCPEHVESELHFLCECKQFKEDREILLMQIKAICPLFGRLDINKKLVYMMTVEGEVMKNIARFIHCHLP